MLRSNLHNLKPIALAFALSLISPALISPRAWGAEPVVSSGNYSNSSNSISLLKKDGWEDAPRITSINFSPARNEVDRESETKQNKLVDRSPDRLDRLNRSTDHKSSNKANSLCSQELPRAIERAISEAELERSQWGILVSNLRTHQVLYDLNADRFLIPASNVKLLSSAAVLHQLGANARIRTSVYDRGNNSLVVVGRGDPSLDNPQLQRLGQQLRQQGRQNISLLTGDDRYFQGELFNPAWAWADVESGDAPPVSSLIVNQSYVQLSLVPQGVGEPLRLSWSDGLAANQWRIANNSQTTRWSGSSVSVSFNPKENILRVNGDLGINQAPEEFGLSVLNPSLYFIQRLETELRGLGINVQQAQVQGSRSPQAIPSNWREIASVESAPLSELLKEMNGNSNNFYAEMLAHYLGKVATGDDRQWLLALEDNLTKLGVDRGGYMLVDASGLARQDQVTPRAIVQTLQAMAQTPDFSGTVANAYRRSLSLAGESGTLRRRLQNTPAAGNFWGKTGSLRGVVALSGYLENSNYDALVVSIIINDSQQSLTDLRQGADDVVDLLSRVKSCPN